MNNKKDFAIIIGSISDYSVIEKAITFLKNNNFTPSYDVEVVSAHRTPDKMFSFAKTAHKKYKLLIAGAGGAAHLPGMVASLTHLPVIGLPIQSKSLKGVDSLLSIVQMPKGVPVATVGINNSINAVLLALRILSLENEKLKAQLLDFSNKQTKSVLDNCKIKV